jgi:hypothetical protein
MHKYRHLGISFLAQTVDGGGLPAVLSVCIKLGEFRELLCGR